MTMMKLTDYAVLFVLFMRYLQTCKKDTALRDMLNAYVSVKSGFMNTKNCCSSVCDCKAV